MAWDDEPPKQNEIAAATPDWASAPPTDKELNQPSAGQAVLHGLEQGSTLGLYDELAGGLEGAGQAVGLKGLGGPLKDVSIGEPGGLSGEKFWEAYKARRDAVRQATQAAEQAHPKTFMASQIVGGLAPTLATGGGAGMTVGKAAGQGALLGGVSGFGSSNADDVGSLAVDTAVGAGIGGAAGAVFGALGNRGKNMQDFAEQKAFKAAGPMLKDYRNAAAKDQVNDIGRFMLDHGLVKAGDSYESIASKAAALREELGDQIGRGYDASNAILGRLSPEAQSKVAAAGFNPVRDKDAILQAAKQKLGYAFNSENALKDVEAYLNRLAAEHGDSTLSPKLTNQIKTALDQTAINWERNPLMREPDKEAALKVMRGFLGDKVSNQIGAIGEATGNPEASAALKALNQKYGFASKVARIADDRDLRESANRFLSPSDHMMAGIGEMIGHAKSGNPGAAIGAATGAIGNKLGRTYGNAAMADKANQVAQFLQRYPKLSGMAQLNPAAFNAMVESFSNRVGGSTPMLTGDKSAPSQAPQPQEVGQNQFVNGN